jgi:uncharacterized protein YndB with AHSA1/START domain
METVIHKKILIDAPVAEVWKFLTDPGLMVKWMGEADFDLKIETTWEVGTPFTIQGFHHLKFENKGVVLAYEPDHIVSYDFLSSLSRLPDTKENRTVLRFNLTPLEQHTSLELTISNFPTPTIYQHLNFYWNATVVLLKKAVEMT